MLAGSNPAARTSQSQSPRSPYRGAGRLFCTRFAGSMASRRHQIMICGSPLSMPSFLFNRLITICGSPPHQSSRLPYCFPASQHRRTLFDPPFRASIRLDETRIAAFLPAFPSRLTGRLDCRSALRSTARPIGFSLSSSPRFPLGGSFVPSTRADWRGGCVFSALVSVFSCRFRHGM